MKYTLFILYIFFSTPLFSQDFSSEMWHKGQLDLITGETMEGMIKYDLEKHIIEYKKNTKNRIFNSSNILAFEIIDALSNKKRIFLSLYSKEEYRFERKIFFELLSEGGVSLFCREKIKTTIENNNYMRRNLYNSNRYFDATDPFYNYPVVNKELDYDYYYINQKNKIKKIQNIKTIFSLFKDKKKEISIFTKENELDPSNQIDLIIIFNYYNQLQKNKL